MVGRHAERVQLARFDSLESAASQRSAILLLPTFLLVGILGCAASLIVPIDAAGPIELAPNEGLLIVHIDTEVALERLVLNNRSVARSLAEGRHVWMVRVPVGSYSWKRIEIGRQLRYREKYRLEPDEEMSFEVEAGKINYPGELVVRWSPLSSWLNAILIVRNRNHSAMAVRDLRGSHDALLSSLPLHYAGSSGDGFLEYYMKKRYQSTAESNGDAHRDDRAGSQSESP
jgi:hypothetical protein